MSDSGDRPTASDGMVYGDSFADSDDPDPQMIDAAIMSAEMQESEGLHESPRRIAEREFPEDATCEDDGDEAREDDAVLRDRSLGTQASSAEQYHPETSVRVAQASSAEQYPPDASADGDSLDCSRAGMEAEASDALAGQDVAFAERTLSARREDVKGGGVFAGGGGGLGRGRSASQPAPATLPTALLSSHSAADGPRHSRVEEAITALQRSVNMQLRGIEDRIVRVEANQRQLFNKCGLTPGQQSNGSGPVRAAWRPSGQSRENYATSVRTSGGGGAYRPPAARRPSRSPSAGRSGTAVGVRRCRSGASPSPGPMGMRPTPQHRRGLPGSPGWRRAGKQRRGGSVPLAAHWRGDSPNRSVELRSSSGTTETLFVLQDELQSIKEFLRHSKGHLAQALHS